MEKNINPICVGTGLVALDVVISNNSTNSAQFFAGGSCGNVMAILSYLGWSTFPIARLSNNVAGELLVEDLLKWKVKDDFLSFTDDGSTPVIIHRILKDNQGRPKHKFEFRNPEDGRYLPSYKPYLAKSVDYIVERSPKPNVFYFDRINRASLNLARAFKETDAIIVFEPSSIKDEKAFMEAMGIADIIKFSNDRIPNYEDVFQTCVTALEIQTLGSSGLKFRRGGNKSWNSIEAFLNFDVIDSAGAGDWCTAGIIKILFSEANSVKSISDSELIRALKFGQVLGALNCTFEGARGLMYHVEINDLLLIANHFINSGDRIINPRRNTNTLKSETYKPLKISSLF